MQKISPFLWFDDKAEEAANFYVSIFKNSAILGVSRYGEGAPRPAGSAMSVTFLLDGLELQALNGGSYGRSCPLSWVSSWVTRTPTGPAGSCRRCWA
jgi:predicted 3-demethylubiquinone-9 3-methyltransferase (glyoxalase superfamily)